MYQKELGDGLLLRWATPEDIKKVPEAVVDVFSLPDLRLVSLGDQFKRISAGEGGLMTSKDCIVIVDKKQAGEPIVAFTSYWQETHLYEGISYRAGRPAWVGVRNKPEFRGKRLQNHIMEALHERSKGDGTLVQVINGINWYYRQYGYEYAFDYGMRSKIWLQSIPSLKAGQVETLKYRRATLDDVDSILTFDQVRHDGCTVFIPMSKVWITSQINDYSQKLVDESHLVIRHVLMLENAEGMSVGYFVIWGLDDEMCDSVISVYHMGFASHVDIPSVLFTATRNVIAFTKSQVDEKRFARFTSVGWHLSRWHPVVEAIPSQLRVFSKLPYEDLSYYARVPDLAAFLKHILPVLNSRLKQSSLHSNHTGIVKLSNYTPRYPGFELEINSGVITKVSQYIKRDQLEDHTVAYFPPQTFLQVLFGRRSIEELQYVFPDVEMEEEIQSILSIIFPKKISIIHHYM